MSFDGQSGGKSVERHVWLNSRDGARCQCTNARVGILQEGAKIFDRVLPHASTDPNQTPSFRGGYDDLSGERLQLLQYQLLLRFREDSTTHNYQIQDLRDGRDPFFRDVVTSFGCGQDASESISILQPCPLLCS